MNTIGIIGAGQLGQMLGQAAARLGLECLFLDPSDHPPASNVGVVVKDGYDSDAALIRLADASDVITYEFENVPVRSALTVEKIRPVFPPPTALECAQDRLVEKTLFTSLEIPVAGFWQVDSESDLHAAIEEGGLPLVIKTRRLGYDGKGQRVLRSSDDVSEVFEALGGKDLIAEEFVEFECEVSAIGSRSAVGHSVFYPLTENEHREGILRVSRAPYDSTAKTALANNYLQRLLDELDYIGTMALEFFIRDGRLLANEFAPRVHNSGHWTIEGCNVSQFENHIRAVTGIPLLEPETRGFAAMVNLIGDMGNAAVHAAEHGAVLHDYGKAARTGRKLGHVTVVAESAEERDQLLEKLQAALQ